MSSHRRRTSHSGSPSPPRSPSRADKYAPAQPSNLRNLHWPPPSPLAEAGPNGEDSLSPQNGTGHLEPSFFPNSEPNEQDFAPDSILDESSKDGHPDPTTRRRSVNPLLWDQTSIIGVGGGSGSSFEGPPTPGSLFGFVPPYAGDAADNLESRPDKRPPGMTGWLLTNLGLQLNLRTTKWLAQRHGVKHRRLMYLYYYIPFFNWIVQYKWQYVSGDLVAAFTMASFYIPMSLSYASNLAHIPAMNGLYAFAINPLIYAVLGTCPQMVVGPEAAGSLLTGSVVRDSIKKGHAGDGDGLLLASIAGTVTGISGAVLLVGGLFRFGFLDSVLSRPFLRGFISAIGFVIVVDQLIPELGLQAIATATPNVSHGSSVEKVWFLVTNIRRAHGLTAAISLGSFAIIMVCRYPKVAYVPDRFLVVVLATILAWKLDWEAKGVRILGDVTAGSSHPFAAHNPFDFSKVKHIDTALSSAFVVALLGFFESSVAAKSLGAAPADGIQNVALSANRELVALGVANVVGGVFMGIPAFGGYGRSKVNSATGGKTPMSSIFLSIITIFCIFVVLPAFHYIPRGVLSAMISVVAWSLIEEAPHDLRFFWRIRGWSELALILIVFVATIFYSLEVGIACGIGFSLLRVIKHATRPRIQIIGRAKGTTDLFENAEADPERVELIQGCLIVKIPEPLTFANTGDLKNRLTRLMQYGTNAAHPALPRTRAQHHNKNLVFDVHGVTELDGAGAQVLAEIVGEYRSKGVRIVFCRVPSPRSPVGQLYERSGIVALCGGPRFFVGSVAEALALAEQAEREAGDEGEYRDEPAAQ